MQSNNGYVKTTKATKPSKTAIGPSDKVRQWVRSQENDKRRYEAVKPFKGN